MTGAILAGGGASRFGGVAKGLERVGGVRIIDRVAAALREVTTDLLIISNDPDAGSWIEGVRAAPDVFPDRGSVLGIHAALAHARRDTLVIAWDMPFVPAGLLAEMVSRRAPGVCAVVPHGPHGLEPCCALYSVGALGDIEQMVRAGVRRLTAMVAGLPGVVELPTDIVRRFGDPNVIFTNINSHSDLERANTISG